MSLAISSAAKLQDDPFFRVNMDVAENPFGRIRTSLFPSRTPIAHAITPHNSARSRHSNSRDLVPAVFHDDILGTFQRMDAMFDEIDNIMRANNHKMTTSHSVTGHSYSATSVMTYVNDGTGRPKVYQASTATCSAPGGIRETRKLVRDSTTGIEKVSVGHHLGDRARVVEKSKNHRTGQNDEEIEFINMDEGDADAFQEEWRRKTIRTSQHPRQRYQKQPIYRDDALFAGSTNPNPYRRLKALTNEAQPAPVVHNAKPTKT